MQFSRPSSYSTIQYTYVRCLPLLQARLVPCCSNRQKGEILSNMETKNYLSRQLGGPGLTRPAVRTLRPEQNGGFESFLAWLNRKLFVQIFWSPEIHMHARKRSAKFQVTFLRLCLCLWFIHSWQNSLGMDGMLKFQRVTDYLLQLLQKLLDPFLHISEG